MITSVVITNNLEPSLLLKSVSHGFEGTRVLDNLDFVVAPGEFVAIIGESGGGKTTLLNLIAGLDQAQSGSITLFGQHLEQLDDAQRTRLRGQKVGFVFQAYHLLLHLKAWQNVALPLLLNGSDSQSAKVKASQMLEQLGLGHRIDSPIPLLSGGEQQRVALARALIHRPALILADEPTGNLDPASARPALELLQSHSRDLGAAVVMVTHSQQAALIADRRLELRSGKLSPLGQLQNFDRKQAT